MPLLKLDELVIEDSGTSFKAKDFRQWMGPLVYAFILKGHSIYVGSSKTGLDRVFGSRHHQREALQAADEVRVWACPTTEAARKLERAMIAHLRPLLNQKGKGPVHQGSDVLRLMSHFFKKIGENAT